MPPREAELKRRLTLPGVLALSITGIMGTGTFLGAALGARIAGEASLTSWLLLFLLSLIMAGVFAELSSAYPRAGGVYEYAKQAYGRLPSFLTGWASWVAGSMSIALLILAAYEYLLPHATPGVLLSLSAGTIILLNLIAAFGIEASTLVILILTVILFLILASILLPGLLHAPVFTLHPTFKPLDKILLAALFLAESFFGWESAAYLAEETKQPRTTIPRAIILGSLIVGLTTLLLVSILLATFGADQLARMNAPLAMLAEKLYHTPLALTAVGLVIMLNLIASAASAVVTLPRLLYSMAKDRLFPHQLARIHPTLGTPLAAIIFQTLFSLAILAAALAQYDFLLTVMLPISFFTYLLMIIALPILRKRAPLHARWRLPLAWLFIPLAAGFFIILIINWILQQQAAADYLLFSASFIILGLPFYLLMEASYNPRFIIRMQDTTLPLILRWNTDTWLKDHLQTYLGDITGKRIVILGIPSLPALDWLIRKAGREGKIYLVSYSLKGLQTVQEWLLERYAHHPDWKQREAEVTFIYTESLFQRLPQSIPQVDIIIAPDVLSTVVNLDAFLLHLARILPPGGRIFLTDTINNFHLIPDPQSVADLEKLYARFHGQGFNIRVEKEIHLLANKLIIHGVKGYQDVPYI